MNSFSIRTAFHLRTESNRLRGCWLSCPEVNQFVKPLADPGHATHGRFDPREHVRQLVELGKIASDTSPLLLCGVRNVLSNYRCIAAVPDARIGGLPVLRAARGEDPLWSERPYYALLLQHTGELQLQEFWPRKTNVGGAQWLLSGVPVLWDDLTPEELFERIQVESADQSHVYRVFRGDHPLATHESHTAFEILNETFLKTLHWSRGDAFAQLRAAADRLQLRRESAYLHHVIGIDANGNLVQTIGHGTLEEIGAAAKLAFGARRAICVENGGSTSVLYYPKGIAGTEISLVASPNQRRAGTAFLAIELSEAVFGVLPAWS